MRKKQQLLIILCISILLLSACSIAPSINMVMKSDEEQSLTALRDLLDSLEKKDADELQQLLSAKATANDSYFETQITDLLVFFEGEALNIEMKAGPINYAEYEAGEKFETLSSSYQVQTTACTYLIAFQLCTTDTLMPENIGILSLFITKTKSASEEFAYWGNQNKNWPLGIHIEECN